MVLFCATAEVLPLDVAFLGADLAATFAVVIFVPVAVALVVAGFFVLTVDATVGATGMP